MRALFILRPAYLRFVRVAPAALFLLGLALILLLSLPSAVLPRLGLWAGALLTFNTFYFDGSPLAWIVGRRSSDRSRNRLTLTLDDVGLHGTRGAAIIDRSWDRLTHWLANAEFIALYHG
jgi:hypothetical protein